MQQSLGANRNRSRGGEAQGGVTRLPAGGVSDSGGTRALQSSEGMRFGDSAVTHPLTPWLEVAAWRETEREAAACPYPPAEVACGATLRPALQPPLASLHGPVRDYPTYGFHPMG